MHVLEPGEVAAHDDQVELLLVLHVVRRQRVAVGPGDPEAERDAAPGGQLDLLEVEAVAAVGDHQPARHVVGGRHLVVTAVGTMTGRALVGDRLRVDRSDDRARTPRDREGSDQGGDEGGDAHRRTHRHASA